MTIHKFLIAPQQENYSVTDGEESLRTQLQGGAGRYRQDILNASYSVRVMWQFNQVQFDYFRAFYKSATSAASTPFLIDIITDNSQELEEHTVFFIPGSVSVTQVQGHTFKVEAQLEVLPIERPDGYFESQVLSYEIAGEDMLDYDLLGLLNALSNVVNVAWPEA